MKQSDKEKYLGDFVTQNGNSKDTISDRKTMAHYQKLGQY